MSNKKKCLFFIYSDSFSPWANTNENAKQIQFLLFYMCMYFRIITRKMTVCYNNLLQNWLLDSVIYTLMKQKELVCASLLFSVGEGGF